MSKRKIGLICLVVVFLGLALLQVFTMGGGGVTMQTVVLPSGHMMTLEKVAYGKVLEDGNPLQNRLTKVLPKWAKDRLGIKDPRKLHDGDPALGVWLRFHGPQKDWPRNSRFKIGRDGDGPSGPEHRHSSPREVGADECEIAIAFPVFPRRGEKLKLTLFQSEKGWEPPKAAEFVLANPVNETFPVWKAESLPAIRRTNNLEFELTRLAFGVGWIGAGNPLTMKFEPAREAERVQAVAVFKIREDGKVSKQWGADGVQMQDATGNKQSQQNWGRINGYDTPGYFWSPTLWRDTGGMRFKFEMTRNPDAGFSTNEMIVLKDVPVPAKTNVTLLNIVTNRLGHTVHIHALLGVHAKYRPTPSQRINASSEPELYVEVKPPLLDKQLDLISVVDDEGRDGRSSGSIRSRPSGTYHLRLKYHNEAKTVDITLAVHRSHYVEYVVEPEILKPVPKPAK